FWSDGRPEIGRPCSGMGLARACPETRFQGGSDEAVHQAKPGPAPRPASPADHRGDPVPPAPARPESQAIAAPGDPADRPAAEGLAGTIPGDALRLPFFWQRVPPQAHGDLRTRAGPRHRGDLPG